MTSILALDLATRTGWALWDGSRRESGVQVFDVRRGESPGMRYLAFNRWLDGLVFPHPYAGEPGQAPRVGMLIYEQTHNRGGAATEVAAGFATRVQEFCARHDLQHAAVHSATLKKFTTGKGNAKKPEMIAAVIRRWPPDGPIRVLTDDEADAIALLAYARAELVGR